MQCISYLGSPSVRCPSEAEGKFCREHSLALGRAPDYKSYDSGLDFLVSSASAPSPPLALSEVGRPLGSTPGRPLDERSNESLMKLYVKVQSAIEARQAFTEMMIAYECRDYGHLKRIYYLSGILSAIEEILDLRARASEVPADLSGSAGPAEVGAPATESEAPTFPEVRKRAQASRKKTSEWESFHVSIAKHLRAISDEFQALEQRALVILERYRGFASGFASGLTDPKGPGLAYTIGSMKRLFKVRMSLGSAELAALELVGIYSIVASVPDDPRGKLRHETLNLGLSELEGVPYHPHPGLAMLLDLARLVVAGKTLVSVADALTIVAYPFGAKAYTLKFGKEMWESISDDLSAAKMDLPADPTGFKRMLELAEYIRTEPVLAGLVGGGPHHEAASRLMLALAAAAFFTKKAYVLSKLGASAALADRSISPEIDLYSRAMRRPLGSS